MNFKLTILQKKDYSENLYKIPLYKKTLPLVDAILVLKYNFSSRKKSPRSKSPKRKSPKKVKKSPKKVKKSPKKVKKSPKSRSSK